MYMYRDKHTKNHDNTNNNDNNHNNNVFLPYFLQICGVVCVKLISVSSSNRKFQSFPLLSYFFRGCVPEVVVPSYGVDFIYIYPSPYPEPVYTYCSNVHWNATAMPLVDSVYTEIPMGDPANTCWVHWNTTGKTYLKVADTGMPLEKLWLLKPTLEHHWRDYNSPHAP